MAEKRKDLDSEQRKVLLERLTQELSREFPDLYYQSTYTVAAMVEDYIKDGAKLTLTETDLIKPLTRYDIQILLALN